jgi:hypothetical protein
MTTGKIALVQNQFKTRGKTKKKDPRHHSIRLPQTKKHRPISAVTASLPGHAVFFKGINWCWVNEL